MSNKFTAHWFSYSSIGDYYKCPKAYYWKNVYKNDKNRKVSIVSPYLSLGVAVHDTLEPLAYIRAEERLEQPLIEIYKKAFAKFHGKTGGFSSKSEEEQFFEKGVDMIKGVIKNPGPIAKPALRMMKDKSDLPHLWLSEKDEIIVSGKPDWLEWSNNRIYIGDFKTGKTIEADDSLQLPMYSILLDHFKKDKPVGGAWYWYLARQEIVYKDLPTVKKAVSRVLEAVYPIKEARIKKEFKCFRGGCRNCEPYERLKKGEGEYLGVGGYNQELYFLPK